MLQRLAGRTTRSTLRALVHANGAAARVSSSDVSLRDLSPAELDWYWSTGEPGDKAGGYAVRAARRSSFATSPAAIPASWACRCSRPGNCWHPCSVDSGSPVG